MTRRAVAVLGTGLLESADVPVLAADDLGLTRGDGCFEATRVTTVGPGDHRIDHLPEHLDRLQASATSLELGDVDRDAWVTLIGQALSERDRPGESMLKLMLTRGRESAVGTPVTGIATVTPQSEATLHERRHGISVVTLGRGAASDGFVDAPWLLGGVKTLSYAVNVAATRTAMQRGADDVIFVSSDGYVLEGPTSAVVWFANGRLLTTPTGATGILDSITQKVLFAAAEGAGLTTGYALGTPSELAAADGVWLVSSGRGAARVHTLDSVALAADPGLCARITALAGFEPLPPAR